MTDVTPYHQILAEALAHESKAHRDQVLARYPEQGPLLYRAVLKNMAKRYAAAIRAKTSRDRRYYDKPVVKERYNQRIAEIDPPWLRRRVEAILWDRAREQQQRLIYAPRADR